ncbi:ribosomal protein S16 [Atractiella rhizophila]|nr:ribosomal protein S16 [Atractiella rhizophila]
MRAPLRLRLSRPSRRPDSIAHNGRPFYNIVLTQSTTARDKRPIEVLGTYDPLPQPMLAPPDDFGVRKQLEVKEKRVVWNRERIVMWLRQGAEPSQTVVRLLVRGGILDSNTKYQGLWKLKPWKDSRPTSEVLALPLHLHRIRRPARSYDTTGSPAG